MRMIIYSITNPLTYKIIYIGKTKNLENRKLAYVGGFCVHNPRLSSLLTEIIHAGQAPIFNILQECDEEGSLEVEKTWIIRMLKAGEPITNRITRNLRVRAGLPW